MMQALIWVVVLGIGFWLFFRWFEHTNVYQPTRSWAGSGADLDVPWENLELTASEGVRLSAWYFPAPAQAAFPGIVVVISHGNGGNISHRLPFYRLLLDLGVHVLAYDYRGYGRSTGRPDEAATYVDGEAAIAWLKSRGFAESNIVCHGESLGGGIAAELALRHPGLRGVILRSTFTSVPDLGTEIFPWLPVRTMGRIRYATREKLPRIRVPVLILHSREDTLVRFHHAEANFAAANEPKWLREIRGDHNDQPEANPEIYAAAVRDFLVATRSRDAVR